MNEISVSRLFVSWVRAVLVAGVLGPSIALAQSADTGTESASDASASVSSRNGAAHTFYVRTGVALDWSEQVRFKDDDCLSVTPAALYGCGPGSDGAPLSSLGDFGTVAGFEIGVGRVATPSLRLEGIVQYRPSFSFDGRANFTQDRTYKRMVSADLSSLSAMAAAYLDLHALGLPRFGPLDPFVGGGIGVSRIDIGETRMEHPEARTVTILPGGHRVNLVWMVTAGVATRLGERTILDLAWRYTDSGTVETGRSRARVVWRDGSRDPLEFDVAGTQANLSSHGLSLSVRYAF